MADQDEWSSDANEAVKISICRPGEQGITTLSTFHPAFTYPIFGEEERIFGYKDLDIHIKFAAHNLVPIVQIKHEGRFKTVGETEATDIRGELKDFVPTCSWLDESSWEQKLLEDQDAASWMPPGDLIENYAVKGRNYEIWRAELTEPATRALLERMQILVSFFIEGGMPLQLQDQDWTLARWCVFFVYEKLEASTSSSHIASPYSLVGYSTSYRFLTYIPSSSTTQRTKSTGELTIFPEQPLYVSSLPYRGRISQFLILPSHQHSGHGTHLYDAMVRTFLADAACFEITVEDPSEVFDDLRDYRDYSRLLVNGTLEQIFMNTNVDPNLVTRRPRLRVPTAHLVDKARLKALRLQNKIAPRQFDRLVEMHLLSKIPPHSRESGTARLTQRAKAKDEGDKAYYFWRLFVKQRIYKRSKDVLKDLEKGEAIIKIEETVTGIKDDYERLLSNLVQRVEDGDTEDMNMVRKQKRKIVDDEDDGEEESKAPQEKSDENMDEDEDGKGRKRVKLS